MSWQCRRLNRKRRRFFVELLENRLLLAGDISQVGYFDTWDGGIIRSTDIAGIAYHPSGRLYLADSEINELSSIFNGDNIFETSLSGDQVYGEIASGNSEPTGITFNEFDGYFYVTNDTGDKLVTRYDSNLNNSLYEFAPQDDVSGAVDPEGITSDPSTGFLYVVDGHNGDRQVLTYRLDLSNPNAATRDVIFQGVFSVASRTEDAEGIAFHEPSGHLFLIDGAQESIFEYTTFGAFVEEYDISGFSPEPSAPQGLTFGPTSSTSDDPSALSLYIADGGSDNFPDGGVYEAAIDVNLPPVLAAIGAQSVEEGSRLTFTASATDPDLPANNLSFSLDSDAPAGATIHPITGEFNWTPAEAQGPAMYSVTVRVTEDGAPTRGRLRDHQHHRQ